MGEKGEGSGGMGEGTGNVVPPCPPPHQWPWDLLCSIGDVVPNRFSQMMNLG